MLSSALRKSTTEDDRLDLVFRALGDRTRREILGRLTQGPAMVTELAEPFDMTLPAVGKHLRVLEKAGLVNRNIAGRIHRCALNPLPLKNVDDWLERYQQFWGESLEALSDYFQHDYKP